MSDMQLRFWGVRGTVPCPGPDTLVYGGNTPCVEVRCGDRLIVLDAGSGLRQLGESLKTGLDPVDFDVLITHCHLDHIMGIPFFAPAYMPGAAIRYWAGHLTPKDRLAEVIAQVMIAPLLPITPQVFRADVTYRDFVAGDPLDLGAGVHVATAPLRHPGGATGYRLTYADKTLAYVTDHEHGPNGPDAALVELARNADVLIYDTTYTDAEYASRQGWGHSTWTEGHRLADAARAKRLIMFHHNPSHTDAVLAEIEAEAAAARPGTVAARENLVIQL